MSRQPRITGDDALRVLARAGWRRVRQRGSHVILRHPLHTGLVVVPIHPGVVLKPKTWASILDQAELRVDRGRGRGR
ncbi:MAG TPA: type II toxin-antitoxin system HicA family toxin [Candidatus Dormibacteraeota bacterium]|nr:type II toxin-antitoxin system HicA family toxin [Candidatus Dormibacteraeota bacterium]